MINYNLNNDNILSFNLNNKIFSKILKNKRLKEIENLEIKLSKVKVFDDLLTCFFNKDKVPRAFRLVQRKAKTGELIYITQDGYLTIKGKCFKVDKSDNGNNEINPHIYVGQYAIYDTQYLVMEEYL